MNKESILKLAKNKIQSIYKHRFDRIIVLEDSLIEFEFGYYIYYQNRKAIESKKLSDMLLGVGPLIIDKETEVVYTTGSSSFDFIDDFCKFKKGEPYQINWGAQK